MSISVNGLGSYVIMGLWSGRREKTHVKPLALVVAAPQSHSDVGGSSGLYAGREKEGIILSQLVSLLFSH